MQGGDISNRTAPRYLFVFEGLLGNFEKPGDRAKRDLLLKAHRWKKAAAMWSIDMYMLKLMWDFTYRRDQSVDILTYLDEREALEVQARLDQYNFPYGNFIVTTIPEFVRGMLNNPSVVAVVDPDPRRGLTYGGKRYDLGQLP